MRDEKTIAERFYLTSQTWVYERVWQRGVGGHKFRVRINCNQHDFQSSIRGYVFAFGDAEWKLIVDKPIAGAACEKVSYVEKNPDKKLFQRDADEVAMELYQIIGG